MSFLARLNDVAPPLAEMAQIANAAGAAVLLFDNNDKINAANEAQERLMPCCSYGENETYASFFWGALDKGMTGNPAAKASPQLWLDDALAARRCSPNLDFVNKDYPWGPMLVSHVRIPEGASIQVRLPMRAIGMENYFDTPETSLGVIRILRLRQEIRSLEGALDSLGLAVALVDPVGSLLHANSSFSDMLRGGDGLAEFHGNGVRAADPLDDRMLRHVLKDVTSGKLPQAYVPIRRRCGEPLILAISAGASLGTAIIAVSRFGEDQREISRAIASALGVTTAEAEVLTGLGAGESAEELSARRGVETKSIYQQVYNAKKAIRRSKFVAPDTSGIVRLVTGLAAITRTPFVRKH